LPAPTPSPDWLATTRNDLEAPARSLAPEIATWHTPRLPAPAHGFARMSGSGATCFGIFETGAAGAKEAAERIRREHAGWFVEATRTMASGEFEDGTH
jgi:4-diphosphocytidyl-2-C-methyl-D-erythritol kinase